MKRLACLLLVVSPLAVRAGCPLPGDVAPGSLVAGSPPTWTVAPDGATTVRDAVALGQLAGGTWLLTAGLLASRGLMNIWLLLIILPIAAILGDNVGYWFGKKTGPRIFNRENSRFFKRKNLLAAKAFYDKHGGKTLVLARFMPFIRTFVPNLRLEMTGMSFSVLPVNVLNSAQNWAGMSRAMDRAPLEPAYWGSSTVSTLPPPYSSRAFSIARPRPLIMQPPPPMRM